MYALVTGSIVKIIINYIIIAIPSVNIYGAPVGTLIGYCCMALLDYIFIRKALRQNPNLLRVLGRPLLCSLLMGASAWLVYTLCAKLLGTAGSISMLLSMGAAVAVAVVVYVAAVVLSRAVTSDDMKLIPGGEKVSRLLHMK